MDSLKVLMVDDESRMRKLVRDFLVREDYEDFLTRKGYEVIEAGDGEEAIDKFYEDKDIALVILDVMMPKMNGWDVCKEIRKNSNVPIIMLTAKSDEASELIVKINDEEIELSFKEFELLTYFVDNKGIALSREKILNNVWNYDYFGDARTIDTHVKKLRKKLGDKGDYIKTIWGTGRICVISK